MEKTALTYMFLSLLFLQVLAQKEREVLEGSIAEKTKEYYKFTHKAEDFIMVANYDSALNCYTNARKIFGLFQYSDRINVIICLEKANSEKIVLDFLKTGYVLSGDSLDSESFIGIYENIISIAVPDGFVDTLHSLKKTTTNDGINYSQVSAILSPLIERDQEYRTGDLNESKKSKIFKQRKETDKSNFKKIMWCYTHFGNFSANKLGEAFLAYRMILLHFFVSPVERERYTDFFLNQVVLGNLDNEEFESIIDNYLYDSTQVYGVHTAFYSMDTLVIYDLDNKYLDIINSNRREIFLEDIVRVHQKLLWQWQNGNVFYIEPLWEIEPFSETQSVINIANSCLKHMGSMVTGYKIYTR